MPPKFDFSKTEDHEKFEKLPEEKHGVIVDETRGETAEIQNKKENSLLDKTPYQSIEVLKEIYKQRLDIILNKQLTVENIETFAEDALTETIQLTEDILIQYRDNPEFHGDTTFSVKQQEDEAFKTLGLSDIQEIFQSIIEVKDKIDSLKAYMRVNAKNIDEVITPPDTSPLPRGEGSWEQKRMFPRVLTLLYILENDFDILPTNVHISIGMVTSEMVRQTSYVRVDVPGLNRTVYLCDEEGNASYIFDTIKIDERVLTLDDIDIDSKGDKNSLISRYPGIGIRLRQTNMWRSRIADALRESLPEIMADNAKQISEFRRKRVEWPSFNDFQREARNLYPGKGDVQKWYH